MRVTSAGPTSPHAAKPSSLVAPVPGKEAELTADMLLAELDMPQSNAQAPAPALDTADALLNEAEPAPEEFATQGDPGTLDFKRQLEEMPTRIATNIARDPRSIQLTLEKRVGSENVKLKGDKFFWRKPGEKAFRPLDSDTFELVNDLFSDFYREGMQGLGAGIGSMTPAGPAGAVAGVVAGGALADAYGETRLGVVKDPDKFKSKDPGLGGQVSRGLERTGMAVAEGAEYVAAEGVFKHLAGAWAARRARSQGLRKLEEVAPVDRLQESVKTNLDTLNEMKSLGLTQRIDGTDIEVPAHQLYPHLPEVQKVAASVSAEKAFQQAQKEAAENFGTATLDLVETASGVASGKLSSAVKSGVPSAKSVSAAEVNGLFNKVRKAEGALIGEFRNKARETSKKSPLPAPKTAEALKDIFGKLGIRNENGKLIFPKDDDIAQILGTDSKAFIGGLKRDLIQLDAKLVKGGGLNIDDLLNLSNVIGAKNEGARRIGGPYKQAIGKLSSSLRSDSRDGMALVLDPADAAEYTAKMQRFGSISKSMDQLDSYLRDDIGMNTFAKGLVSRGKEGLPNLRAAKEFLLQEDPSMYKNLIGEYMEELALKHRKPGSVSGFDAAAMKKELVGLGGEYLDELFPAKGAINKGLVIRSFDLSSQLEKSLLRNANDKDLISQASGIVSNLSKVKQGINLTMASLHLTSKDSRMLKLLSREGVEAFLVQTPKKDRPRARQALTAVLAVARKNGTLATINSYQPTPQRLPGPEQE